MEIRYYHLEKTRAEEAMPVLLSKCMERQWRALVKARSEARLDALSDHLWTYDDQSFLPHGSKADGYSAHQPIWLTLEDENPNGAQVLFLTDGADADAYDGFDLVCRLFDGRDDTAIQGARTLWKRDMDAGCHLTYWQQGPRGWEKKQEKNKPGATI